MVPFTNRQVLYPGKRITLPGLGEFRLKQRIPFLCSSQTFTISRTANHWFVSFVIDIEKVPPIYHEVQSVGIDLGVKCFATLSDSSQVAAPPTLKKAKTRAWAREFTSRAGRRDPQGKLRKEQWRNRNKQLGNKRLGIRASNNAKKSYKRLGARHARLLTSGKISYRKRLLTVFRKYYKIRIEDLNLQGMAANHKLAEAISSLGLYEFRRMLTYKQSFYGTKVELVDRWYPSSKMCSCCKSIQPMR